MSYAQQQPGHQAFEALGPNNRWKVTGIVGAGGFSTVYSAVDTRFESPVAIKVLADNLSTNLDIRERFLSEALLLRQNPGPVVPVYDTGETPSGQPFLVMPLADGGDLATRIEGWRRVAVPTVDDTRHLAEILSHVVAGLHEQGVVHRDLKPSNLLIFGARKAVPDAATRIVGPLINRGETVLLSDLGFAKDLAKNSGLTVGGGTPGYTPPEQRHAGQIDHRADIWGASAIMYWFLVGYPPSDSTTLRQDNLASMAAPGLIDAIEAGLAENPDNRPPNMAAWYQNIDVALRATQAPTGQPVGNRASPNRGLRVAGALAALATTFALGFAAATFIGFPGDRFDTRVVQGVATSTATAEDLTVSINGPNVIELGSTVTYTAELDPELTEWVWISPAGTFHANEPSLPLEATNLGRGEVTLIATTATGENIRVAIDIEVVT